VAHKVINTIVPALEDTPERFGAVCACVATDILSCAMVDPVSRLYDVVIYCEFVRVKLAALLLGIAVNNIADRFGVHAVYGFGHYVTLALNNPDHGGLCFGAASLIAGGFLIDGLVLFFTAHIGFVNLHLAGEHRLILAVDFADSVIQKPGRLLSNADHFGKLNARNTFPGRGEKIDSEKPLIERELGLSKDRPCSDGKFQAAIVALIGLVIRERIDVLTSAIRAVNAVCKASGGKIFNASIFGGEFFVKLLY